MILFDHELTLSHVLLEKCPWCDKNDIIRDNSTINPTFHSIKFQKMSILDEKRSIQHFHAKLFDNNLTGR